MCFARELTRTSVAHFKVGCVSGPLSLTDTPSQAWQVVAVGGIADEEASGLAACAISLDVEAAADWA